MDYYLYLRAVFSLVFIVLLLYGCSYLAKKYLKKYSINYPNSKRLKIVETLFLEYGKKIVILKNNDVEYLLLIEKNQSILIDKKNLGNNLDEN